jgi:ubiquitin-protein ligase
MGADYPMFAPTARFVTPIYHPNINRHGRICHSILDRHWTVDTSNKDLIDTIYSLLLVPDSATPSTRLSRSTTTGMRCSSRRRRRSIS